MTTVLYYYRLVPFKFFLSFFESSEAYFFEKRKIENEEGKKGKERKWFRIQCVKKNDYNIAPLAAIGPRDPALACTSLSLAMVGEPLETQFGNNHSIFQNATLI